MTLEDEIRERSREIHTDWYPMSIGELMTLYRDGELHLQPEFQRFFRWTSLQKSRLIESILLGIPIPSIFVAQRSDGVWDVVDGLQRLSTIFEFVGILRDDKGEVRRPSKMTATQYLPSLEGCVWDAEAYGGHEEDVLDIGTAQRLAIKRAKLTISIVKKESSADTKLELFHRLNSFGSRLSDQEQRDCLLILTRRESWAWGTELARNDNFITVTGLSDTSLEQKYDVELVWRFVAIRASTPTERRKISDMAEFITTKSLSLSKIGIDFDWDAEASRFRRTFKVLEDSLGEDGLRQWDPKAERFKRSFLISSFEAVAIGVAANVDAIESLPDGGREFVSARVKSMWMDDRFLDNMGSGKTPARRLSHLPEFGELHFRPT
jgi:hypothetical protein